MRRYTGAEAKALREAATPGPWRWVENEDGRRCNEGGIYRADGDEACVLWLGDSEPYENSCGVCESGRDRALCAAAPDLAATVEALEVELTAANKRWDCASDRWCVYHSEQGLEWFDTRADAEAFAVDYMTDLLRDSGEAHDDQCTIMAVVASTEEVVGGTAQDDTPDGDWCRDRGVDYIVSGYKVTPGTECGYNDLNIERQIRRVAELEAERDALRRSLARCYALAGSDPDTDDGATHLYGDAERAVRELREDYDEAVREGGAILRASVVAWLRTNGLHAVADDIETGKPVGGGE